MNNLVIILIIMENNTRLLIYYIKNGDVIGALKIIQTKNVNFSYVCDYSVSLLMIAIQYKLQKVVFELIRIGINIDHVDSHGDTALIYACRHALADEALELIKTGKSKLEQVNGMGETALILACKNAMDNVALELIKTGMSKPEQTTMFGKTALIEACNNYVMKDVAVELIKVCNSNLECVDEDSNTAAYYAQQNSMDYVVALIHKKLLELYD